MKKTLLTLLLLGFSLLALSQGSWSPRAPLPDSGRYGGVSFSIGNYGYIGLGYHAEPNHIWLKDFWQFNPSTNLWVQKANFPGKARWVPATFVIGNKGYVVTGVDSDITSYSTECWEYNPTSDVWIQKASFPGLARGYDVGFAIGGKGYVGIGGQAYALEQKDFYSYDTATNTWARIADFPGVSRIDANAFSVNGKGYVCFGADSSLQQFYGDMWEYDTGTNAWTQKSSYPGQPVYGASGFVIGNDIYVGTGANIHLKVQPQFWEYQPAIDSWINETNYPGISKVACFSFAIGDTGYMGLGTDSELYCYTNFYRFFPDSTAGINDIKNNNAISIYPNPFNSFFTVSIPCQNSSSVIFKLFDIQGNEISVSTKEHTNYYVISRNNLPEGTYILYIQINNQVFYKKIIAIN